MIAYGECPHSHSTAPGAGREHVQTADLRRPGCKRRGAHRIAQRAEERLCGGRQLPQRPLEHAPLHPVRARRRGGGWDVGGARRLELHQRQRGPAREMHVQTRRGPAPHRRQLRRIGHPTPGHNSVHTTCLGVKTSCWTILMRSFTRRRQHPMSVPMRPCEERLPPQTLRCWPGALAAVLLMSQTQCRADVRQCTVATRSPPNVHPTRAGQPLRGDHDRQCCISTGVPTGPDKGFRHVRR